jgi:hypothetical protein
MKFRTTSENLALGMDQSVVPSGRSASYISNMRYDGKYYWVGDRGFEPLIRLKETQDNFSDVFLSYITRLFHYSRHNGAESYILQVKENGNIYYQVQNINGLSTDAPQFHLVAENRSQSRPQDPGEQFIPTDRLCIIINGKDDMLKFYGRDRTLQFGFTTPTPAPEALGVDTRYYNQSLTPPRYPSAGAVAAKVPDLIGLGIGDPGELNTYRYKISFIRDTGSESPLSNAIEVEWTVPAFENDDFEKYGVYLQNIPVGPPGTVARVIYRTKNLRDFSLDSGEAQFYFVDQINDNVSTNYMDIKPDNLLLLFAPGQAESVVISNTYKFGASWNGHIWLAGKSADDLSIIYSKRGFLEQFPATNFLLLGNSEAGRVTALMPYYDNLLVFREKSIEMIRSRGNGDTYSVSILTNDIGTIATNTIKNVPGQGVFFLSYDGIYKIKGGTLGGSSVSVEKISELISDEIERINVAALPRACAAYSEKEDEYWVYAPTLGSDIPNKGFVFHEKIQQFSIRDTHPVNDIITIPGGWFAVAFEQTVTEIIEDNIVTFEYKYPGVHVWSANQSAGTIVIERPRTQPGGGTYFEVIEDDPLFKSWESPFLDFGDNSVTKRVQYVEVNAITIGNRPIQLDEAYDWRDIYVNPQTKSWSNSQEFNSREMDALLGPASAIEDRVIATTEQSLWGRWRVSRIRFDVNSQQCYAYKFRLRSQDVFNIISYTTGPGITQPIQTRLQGGAGR